PLPSHGRPPAAFSRDGRRLAVGDESATFVIWDWLAGHELLRRSRAIDPAATFLPFSPDGRRLVCGLDDSTLLVWEVGARPTRQLGKLGEKGLATAWADLASSDAPRAFRARWTLASTPEESIPLLNDRF